MSWQSYVDEQLVASGSVNRGAILGLDGSVWAKSPSFEMTDQEAANIAYCAQNSHTLFGEEPRPLMFGGVRFMVLKAEDNTIYMRKESDGGCIAKTNQCVVIGMYGDGMQAGKCNVTVERLADYLKDNGY